jgi:acyl-CoA thioesterase-1
MSNLKRYVRVALLVQLLAACSGEAPAPGPVENRVDQARKVQPDVDRPLVLAFGDSLFAGYQLGQNESFPVRLERALAAAGVPAQVSNAGVSGDTSAAGLQRLAYTLDGLDRRPALAIVGLGGNDVLRGLDPDETKRNLGAILAELRRREIPVMLSGMMAPRNMGEDYVQRFDRLYPELAAEYGADLYPFFLDGVIGRPELLLADGIHPNARGIEAIVARMAPAVARKLEPQAADPG